MITEDTKELKLVFDLLPLTKDNCLLPPTLDGDNYLPNGSEVVLAAVPTVLAVGHDCLLSEDSWDNIMKALMTTEKQNSITGGKPQKGFVTAYTTLKANKFHSYL